MNHLLSPDHAELSSRHPDYVAFFLVGLGSVTPPRRFRSMGRSWRGLVQAQRFGLRTIDPADKRS
jgi:hypothetical protein